MSLFFTVMLYKMLATVINGYSNLVFIHIICGLIPTDLGMGACNANCIKHII